MKVTLVPAQIAPAGEAAMLTVGVAKGVTVIVIAAEVAVVGDTQAAFDVKITRTWSPFASVELVNVAPTATFVPLTWVKLLSLLMALQLH